MKTRNTTTFFAPLALLGLLSFCGCEKTVARTDYFPLRDGNRWDYRLLDMPLLKRMESGQKVSTERNASSGGASVDSDLSASAQFVDPSAPPAKEKENSFRDPAPRSSATAEDRSVASARRVTLELRDSIDPITFKSLYDTAEQVWSKRNGYVGFQSPRGRNYLLMLPPHTGYKWVVTGSAGQELFYQIESANVSIDTPAGKFDNCVLSKQESRDRKEVFKYWFAPNVGLVRRSKYFHDEEVFRQELVEYSVQPATPATRMEEDREVRRAIEGKNRGSEFRDKGREARDERPNRRGYIPPSTLDDEENEKVQQNSDPK